nr:hypothetical protein [Tanacetum cinerariifolium]
MKAHCKHYGKFLKHESNSTLKMHIDKYCEGLKFIPKAGQASMSREGSVFAYEAERCRQQFENFMVGRLDVCVDLTGSSHVTQTGMADFASVRLVIDATQRELENDAVTLLKRIQKFFMTQYIRARAAVHIFNRIGFVVAKEVGAQIVSWLFH